MKEQQQQQQEANDELFIEDDEEDNTQNKYLLFKLADEVYGISIFTVTDIIEMQKITQVPDMPPFIKGIINLRGKVIPAMDLRIRFDLEEREYDDRTCIIVVNVENTSMGLIVDTVSEVLEIPEGNIDPPPTFRKDSVRDQYIQGLGKVEDEVKILINVNKILGKDDFEAVKNVVGE